MHNWSEILVHTQNIMKFLRKRACTLACSPLRIVLSLLMGWAAMWVFIWCYIWTVATTLATWFALQSLHYIFSAAATVRLWSTLSTWWSTMRDSRTAGGWWKASYKLERGPADNEQLFYMYTV